MSTLPDTIFLNPTTWDLDIDASGNIALASTPYAQAQNVACACRMWLNEAPLNTAVGIPYEQSVLGYRPALQQLASWFKTAAEGVQGITTATPVLQYDSTARDLSGSQIQVTLEDDTQIGIAI
jgi:hypothetical protein